MFCNNIMTYSSRSAMFALTVAAFVCSVVEGASTGAAGSNNPIVDVTLHQQRGGECTTSI